MYRTIFVGLFHSILCLLILYVLFSRLGYNEKYTHTRYEYADNTWQSEWVRFNVRLSTHYRSSRRRSSRQSLALVRTTKINRKINQTNTEKPKITLYHVYRHARKRRVTNKTHTHAQYNYTNTKRKAWCRRLLCHTARKRSGPILHQRTHRGGIHDRAQR